MTKFAAKVKRGYDMGVWNIEMVRNAVEKERITIEEYEEITGEEYMEPE